MSELSLAYIFHNQQLLVDENHKLPSVEAMTGDLKRARATMLLRGI